MEENFVFLGDSLTFGYGVKKVDNWVTKLKNSTDLHIINKGVNGSTTTDMLNRFNEDVVLFNPSKVFIMGGTNDLLSNHSIKSIIDNIEIMVKELTFSHIKVVIGIPPTILAEDANKLFIPSLTYSYAEDNLPLLKATLIKLCNKYDCTYIDFYNLTKENLDENIFFDGIHLNVKGQDLLFEEAKKNLF